MTPQNLVIALKRCYHIDRPSMIWGPPGVGKSDLVGQVAEQIGKELKDKNFGLIDFRMALRDPTDIKGFPMPDAKTQTMKFFRDGELPRDGRGILFMDELPSATPATQAAGMQLTLGRRIGDYELPKGWTIFAAGNRQSDRGVVHAMPSPLANRMTHFEYDVEPKDWVQWALDHDVSPELIAFIRFKPSLLFDFDPKKSSKAFPTPRSWVATEDFAKSNDPDQVKFECIKGTVGDGPGAEYWGFLKMIDQLPTIEEIRVAPEKTKVPGEDQPSARHAITTLLGAHAGETTFEAFFKYMQRMDKEFQCVYVRDAIRREPKLRTNRAFTQWILNNSDVILPT
jgi:hypothetical protein